MSGALSTHIKKQHPPPRFGERGEFLRSVLAKDVRSTFRTPLRYRTESFTSPLRRTRCSRGSIASSEFRRCMGWIKITPADAGRARLGEAAALLHPPPRRGRVPSRIQRQVAAIPTLRLRRFSSPQRHLG